MLVAPARNYMDFQCTNQLLIEPYKIGLKNFRLAFQKKDEQPNNLEKLFLKSRIFHAITGFLYLLPIINSIIYIASCLINSYKNKKDWDEYYKRHPLNDLTDNNIKSIERHIANAVRNACNENAGPETKNLSCLLAELHFNEIGELKHTLYGYDVTNRGCLKDSISKDFYCIKLRIKLTNDKYQNKDPFYICSKDLENYSDYYSNNIRDIMQMMLYKLNDKYSKIAVINFAKFNFQPILKHK